MHPDAEVIQTLLCLLLGASALPADSAHVPLVEELLAVEVEGEEPLNLMARLELS